MTLALYQWVLSFWNCKSAILLHLMCQCITYSTLNDFEVMVSISTQLPLGECADIHIWRSLLMNTSQKRHAI